MSKEKERINSVIGSLLGNLSKKPLKKKPAPVSEKEDTKKEASTAKKRTTQKKTAEKKRTKPKKESAKKKPAKKTTAPNEEFHSLQKRFQNLQKVYQAEREKIFSLLDENENLEEELHVLDTRREELEGMKRRLHIKNSLSSFLKMEFLKEGSLFKLFWYYRSFRNRGDAQQPRNCALCSLLHTGHYLPVQAPHPYSLRC